MKKSVFAVCDPEEDYARRFMDHLNRKKSVPFELQAFTSAEELITYGKKEYIELLLISEKIMCREIGELEIGKIILLSEGMHLPELEVYPSVYKYQSSSDVVREVMARYGEEKAVFPAQFPVLKKTTEILGVYSPVGRCLKTSFALTLGQVLARKQAVLYLNLEEYSGFEELMGRTFSLDLSDLLYFVHQDNPNLAVKMGGMIQTVNGLDYIPPVRSPADIPGTAWEDWEKLLREIELHSSYEVLILDIGNGIGETFQLLDKCSRIYMPVLTDVMSMCKITHFENLLSMWDYPQILEKLEKIRLPPCTGTGSAKPYAEQLMWGELGEYVREMLRREAQ